MPFVIQCPPYIEPGIVSDAMVMNVDFAPTLLDYAGLPIPAEMQGESFRDGIGNPDSTMRDAVYYHYYEYPIWHKVQPHYGIRTNRYKLMHFYYSMDNWELYDLHEDPNETNNIYTEAAPELIDKLKGQLEELRVQNGDDRSLQEMRLMTDTVITRVYTEPSKAK